MAIFIRENISQTVSNTATVTINRQSDFTSFKMAYVEANGHVTDDVKWPWKVKVVIPIRLEPSISKTDWDAI